MNQKEQARLSVLNSVLEYQVAIVQAAEVLGVSPRHARRLLAAYRQDGATALAHGNRGRRPHNAIPSAEAAAVVELATGRYEGANHTHLTELLSEREGIDLSRPTVRRILAKAGIGSPRSRRSPQHRFRRQRMPQAGMLLQLDGSHHAWLEDRGTKFALLLAVDDATSAVVNAVFCISENTAGYFTLLEGLIERWGIPLALYSDRHAVFKHNARKPETAAEATQFTRSLQELGIRQIFARSPQAKGRVERAAGTFQDRLVTELRLSDARTMDQATAVLQDFLPRYNARFAVQPEHPEPAYRQLIVRYEGRRVATQEPPPRMGALWAGVTAWSPGPELKRVVSSVGDHHISRSQQRRLTALEPVRPAEPAVKPVAGKDAAAKDAASKTSNPWTRTPTPTQLARWKAIQKGRLKGLSLRAISRELGISRVTVRKYAYAEKPPTKKLSAKERAKLLALRKSTTVVN